MVCCDPPQWSGAETILVSLVRVPCGLVVSWLELCISDRCVKISLDVFLSFYRYFFSITFEQWRMTALLDWSQIKNSWSRHVCVCNEYGECVIFAQWECCMLHLTKLFGSSFSLVREPQQTHTHGIILLYRCEIWWRAENCKGRCLKWKRPPLQVYWLAVVSARCPCLFLEKKDQMLLQHLLLLE